ncbi:PIN domain-containing protein [Microbacterium sp.]|uniref:PIN domain-containing protein n=1 Tax=Microbacterium sp. TaxID=51671 RepID=UPI0039E2C4A0
MSSLSLTELGKGLNAATDVATLRARAARLESVCATFGVGIPFDDRCAEAYERLLATVARRGGSARPHMLDRMLAATALAHGMTLVARDLRAYADLAEHVRIERR